MFAGEVTDYFPYQLGIVGLVGQWPSCQMFWALMKDFFAKHKPADRPFQVPAVTNEIMRLLSLKRQGKWIPEPTDGWAAKQNTLRTKPNQRLFRETMETASYPGHLGRIPTRVGKQLRRRPGGKSGGAGKHKKTKVKRKRPASDRSSSEEEEEPQDGDGEGTKKKKTVGGGLKADHWKRILQMLPVALFNAWRNPGTNDIINMTDEERSYQDRMREEQDRSTQRQRSRANQQNDDGENSESDQEDKDQSSTVSMDRRKWYDAALGLTASLRILHAHFITYQEACDAVEVLALVSRSLLEMGAHLIINWHAAMHYVQ